MHYSRKNPTYGSVNPTDEPYAREASQWMESHALRKTVYLEFDQRREDRYRRMLAFVYPTAQAATSLNAEILRLGFAKMLFLGKNRLHEAEFQDIENDARLHQRGLWSTR
jgi:micrococcal nuclease